MEYANIVGLGIDIIMWLQLKVYMKLILLIYVMDVLIGYMKNTILRWIKKMPKAVLMKNIYIGYPESLYSSEAIQKDKYLSQMVIDVDKLPPITVIKLSDIEYSLSDGYHRISIFMYLNYKKIICNIL